MLREWRLKFNMRNSNESYRVNTGDTLARKTPCLKRWKTPTFPNFLWILYTYDVFQARGSPLFFWVHIEKFLEKYFSFFSKFLIFLKISHFSQNFSNFSNFSKFLKFLKISQISQISQNFWEFLSFSQISHFFMNFPRNLKKIIIKLFVLNTIVVYFWWRK